MTLMLLSFHTKLFLLSLKPSNGDVEQRESEFGMDSHCAKTLVENRKDDVVGIC